MYLKLLTKRLDMLDSKKHLKVKIILSLHLVSDGMYISALEFQCCLNQPRDKNLQETKMSENEHSLKALIQHYYILNKQEPAPASLRSPLWYGENPSKQA